MKKWLKAAPVIILLVTAGNMAGAEQGGHMMGAGMLSPGLASYNMMGYNMMTDRGCPMMMNIGSIVDRLIMNKKELSLSKSQIAELKRLRDAYLKEVVGLNAELSMQMLELNGLVNDEEINLVKIKEVSTKIEDIENEIRMKSIEEYAKAKMQLTKDQLSKARSLGFFDIDMHTGYWQMME